MKKYTYIIIAITYCFFTGCKVNTDTSRQGQVVIRQTFKKEIYATPKSMSIDTMMAFENWNIIDSLLLIESNGTEDFFYVFHSDNFKMEHSFGKKGNGPEEFIMPHLIQGAPDIMILDNALHSINWLSSDTGLIERKTMLPLQNTYWQPHYFDENTLCFIQNSPNELKWVIYDMQTKEIKDSLLFIDETNKGNTIQYEFAYYVDTTQLAISFNYDNVTSYYKIHNKKLIPQFTIKGERLDDKMYGTGVFIFRDNIYVLNQENIDMQTHKGESYLDVYSKGGDSLCRVHLNMIAGCMLLDLRNERILFYSPENEDAFFSILLSELKV